MLHDERSREEIRRLEDDFFDWFEAADAEELEDGTLDGFLEELERMDPMPGDFDPQKSLADFHEKYAALLEPQKEEKRQNHISRRAFFAVAAVAAVLASMVTAQAFGVDIFGFFGRWTDDIFTLTSAADKAGYQKRFYPMEEGQTTTYSSLRDALDDFQLDLPLFPFWIPERFPEQEAVGTVTPDGLRIRTSFFAEGEGGQEALTIEYSESGEEGLADVMEKASLIYEAGEISHYVTTEQGHCTAVWIQDDLQCGISGDVTEEEMKDILDSLYYYYPTYEEDVQSRKEERHYPVENCAGMEFGSLLEALYTFRVHTNLAPSWFLEDIGKFDVSGKITPRGMEVYALSRAEMGSGQRTVTIVYTEFGEDGPGLIIEKDENPPIAYEKIGVTHYITTDHGFCTAAWVRENIEAMIFGPVTVEEMKQIIDSIYESIPSPLSEEETLRYNSIEEALEELQFDIAAPQWFPERFGELEVTGVILPEWTTVYASMRAEQGYDLMIHYDKWEGPVAAAAVPKDGNPPVIYEKGGIQHYIMTDYDIRKAVWMQGAIQCIISGSVTEEEMKQIIDSIYSNEAKEAESPPPSSFAGSLRAALDECGISGNLVPAWYPEGFEASEPVISRTKRYDTINVTFQDDKERFFGIMIICYQSMEDVELFTFEKDKTPVEQYTSGGKTFYIFSNDDTITAVWADGLIHESIAGNLTVEEFKKIIDSIDS